MNTLLIILTLVVCGGVIFLIPGYAPGALAFCVAVSVPTLKAAESKGKTGGIVLGIMEQFPFEEETISLKPGDVIVIYSDGVAEAMNAQDEQFGEERLIADHKS